MSCGPPRKDRRAGPISIEGTQSCGLRPVHSVVLVAPFCCALEYPFAVEEARAYKVFGTDT